MVLNDQSGYSVALSSDRDMVLGPDIMMEMEVIWRYERASREWFLGTSRT